MLLQCFRSGVVNQVLKVKWLGQWRLHDRNNIPVLMSAVCMSSIKQRLDDILTAPSSSFTVVENKVKQFCQDYHTLPASEKCELLSTLARDYGANQEAVIQYTKQLTSSSQRILNIAAVLKTEERIRNALTPKYQHLFTQISRLEHGVKLLVDIRADLLNMMSSAGTNQDNPYLQVMNANLRNLLSLWFSVGFLNLERVTWESPCDMLQKISEYEAVHPIRNWVDLRRRVGPYRRCYVFTHGSMPREPVVVLHVALTTEISNSVQEIVMKSMQLPNGMPVTDDMPNQTEDPTAVNTAIFYSITSTQKGLQGVELGNYLIKNAVRELLLEFPHMCNFSSLSPIPGFRDWLIGEINQALHKRGVGEGDEKQLLKPDEVGVLQQCFGAHGYDVLLQKLKETVVDNLDWAKNEQLCTCLQQPLMRLCARYILKEKRRNYALNPVAGFHLRNGAVVWRINWLADTSVRGLKASCGLMVNYRYYLQHTEEYSKRYVEQYVISAAVQVTELIEPTSESE